MTEQDFCIYLGKLEVVLTDGEEMVSVIKKMISMLDSCDHEDFFGTEGWRYHFGWGE